MRRDYFILFYIIYGKNVFVAFYPKFLRIKIPICVWIHEFKRVPSYFDNTNIREQIDRILVRRGDVQGSLPYVFAGVSTAYRS